MGILSSSVSITRYQVKGHLKAPVLETVANGLKKNAVSEIDGNVSAEDLEGFVIEKTYHYDKLIRFFERITVNYIKLRISDGWEKSEVAQIRKWIQADRT